MKSCSDEKCSAPATKLVMVMVFLKGREDGFVVGGVSGIPPRPGFPYCSDHADKLDPKAIARAIPPLPEGAIEVERSQKAIHELSWYEPGGKFFRGHG